MQWLLLLPPDSASKAFSAFPISTPPKLVAQPLKNGASEMPSMEYVEALTDREREVLALVAKGASNRQIGETLYITEGTVKNHMSNILSKLGLRDRMQAALYAREMGLG